MVEVVDKVVLPLNLPVVQAVEEVEEPPLLGLWEQLTLGAMVAVLLFRGQHKEIV